MFQIPVGDFIQPRFTYYFSGDVVSKRSSFIFHTKLITWMESKEWMKQFASLCLYFSDFEQKVFPSLKHNNNGFMLYQEYTIVVNEGGLFACMN